MTEGKQSELPIHTSEGRFILLEPIKILEGSQDIEELGG